MLKEANFSLQDILAVENDPELLRIFCPDAMIPAWAFIRVPFIRTIMSDMLFSGEGLIGSDKIPIHAGKLKFLLAAIFYNSKSRRNQSDDICYFSTGLGNFEQNGKVHDRLVGYFAQCYPDKSLVYQGHGDWTWRTGFQARNILFSTPFNVYSNLAGRVTIRDVHREVASGTIDVANNNWIAFSGSSLDAEHLARLRNTLARQLAAFPLILAHYRKWFARHEAKMLVKEDACYGGASIAILEAAKLSGITTVEFQHGAISKGHDGYNIAPALANDRNFQRTLPEYLLTYGDWWSQQSNMPVKKVAIGNPHFAESIKGIARPAIKQHILILGDGIDTEVCLELAGKIAKLVGRHPFRIVFRPHPLERAKLKTLILPDGVEADRNSDIYESINQALVVISELSTGLFEAVGLGCHALIWSTKKSRFAFPELPFPSFSSIEELDRILEPILTVKSENRPVAAPQQYWAADWEANFRTFVEGVLAN